MKQGAERRRLFAIVAMDVVGYSRLMGVDEVGTVAALKSHRASLIDPVVEGHRGRLVKTTGDGLLLTFDSAVDAISAAVAIQRGMLERNGATAEDRRMVFRIGINIGDVLIDGDDIQGDGVNVAARLESLCEPGGVLISRSANEQVRDKLAIAFDDMGEHTVKNIARAVGMFGLSAAAVASLTQAEVDTVTPPRPARHAGIGGRAGVAVLALSAVLLAGGAAAWWLGWPAGAGRGEAKGDVGLSLTVQVEQALARSVPSTPESLRHEIAVRYAEIWPNRALAVAGRAAAIRMTGRWHTRESAEEKVLERCQQIYNEPCALVALNDGVLPAGPQGWPERDMPRVRYAGIFNPERIPGMRDDELQRSEIANYATAPGPKAMAFNANGILAVAHATSARSAEQQALALCRLDPRRNEREDGPCYVYAVDNKVVLPLRSLEPLSPAATPAEAAEATALARLIAVLDGLLTNESTDTRVKRAVDYNSAAGHKALAVLPGVGTWRASGRGAAADAEERALESCEMRYGRPCVLAAVDDRVSAGDVLQKARPMPRVEHAGEFEPGSIPLLSDAARQRGDVMRYRGVTGPKAAAMHPTERIYTVTGVASQREAEEGALAACNAEIRRLNVGNGPCLLYASGNRVVLQRRSTTALTP